MKMDPHKAAEGTQPGALFSANKQPSERPVIIADGLDVHSVFPTIQGEGPFVGEPAVFVRLAGCNLVCPGCDTDYTSGRQLVPTGKLLGWIRNVLPKNRLVVITGGEPFRQDIRTLVSWLADFNIRVQIETNGTLWRDIEWDYATVVCAPKTPSLDSRLVPHIKAYKYVLEADKVDPADGLPLSILGKDCRVARPPRGAEVFVQPFDSGNPESNKRHTETAVWSALTYGYRLCLQTHKMIGVP